MYADSGKKRAPGRKSADLSSISTFTTINTNGTVSGDSDFEGKLNYLMLLRTYVAS